MIYHSIQRHLNFTDGKCYLSINLAELGFNRCTTVITNGWATEVEFSASVTNGNYSNFSICIFAIGYELTGEVQVSISFIGSS